MKRYSWIIGPALVLLAGLLVGSGAMAQEKPKDSAAKPAPAAGASVAKDAKKPQEQPKPKIAVFRLAGPVEETPKEEVFNFGGETGISLETLVSRMDKAAKDGAVKAVVILLDQTTVGSAQVEELRQAIARLRTAGKDVIAHADTITSLGQYALLSAASHLSVVPTADLWITGLYGESPYLHRLLEKIHVQPDFMTCGDYKSAAEIFMRESPSKEAEAMQNWLLDSLYDTLVKRIAASRKVSPELVKAWIDSGPHSAEKAKELGIVDSVEHRQDLEKRLKHQYGTEVVFDRKYGTKAEPKLDASSPFALLKFWGELLGAARASESKKPAIGIVYVEGPILLSGQGASIFQDRVASSSSLRKALNAAADDDTIKAVILRVDSPGGSALASEIILDATRRVKSRSRSPCRWAMWRAVAAITWPAALIRSSLTMRPSPARSGSSPANWPRAASTITWAVTFKSYRRGQNAGMLASGEVFSPGERLKMRSWMDEIYGVFKGHVTAVRGNRLKKPIDELAGGRVYTGKQALDLGLVDRLGTLHDAVKYAAAEAKLTDYELRVIPKPKSFLEQLMEDGADNDSRKGLDVVHRPTLLELAQPYLRSLDPARAELVRTALGRLELLNREGVILMMPELNLGR